MNRRVFLLAAGADAAVSCGRALPRLNVFNWSSYIDPATITHESYPLLFQTGETAYGHPLVDAQPWVGQEPLAADQLHGSLPPAQALQVVGRGGLGGEAEGEHLVVICGRPSPGVQAE